MTTEHPAPSPAATSTTSTREQHQLQRGSLGVFGVTFFVISAAAPLTAMAGGAPVAMLLGNGPGVPGAYIVAVLTLLVFAVGYTTMARHHTSTGAFYSYVTRGLRQQFGGAAAYLALLSYLYDECGALQIGDAGSGGLLKSIASAEQFDLPHEILDAAALRSRYPQHRVDDHTVAVLDHRAGSLYPEASVMAAVETAKSHGAQVLTNTEVIDFDEAGGRLQIITDHGTIACDKVVVATGSWTTRLRPDLKGFLSIIPLSLTWFMPRHPQMFTPERFPVFIRDEDGVHLYGTPSHDSYSIKVATEPLWPAIGSPDEVPEFSRADLTRIGSWAANFLPDLNPEPVKYSMHHELCTPGDLPLVDLDADTGMLLLTAFSGRGFKFAPVYGQIAADLITGTPTDLYDPSFALSAQHR